MEQLYLIEIFVDKVSVFVEDGDQSTANKNLIVKLKFGPNVQFIVKEGQLAVNEEKREDIIEVNKNGRNQWSRTIRVGKSYLFPSYPDTILSILSKFPLEIEVWNDDDTEPPHKIYVGVGSMLWDTQFFIYLKETADACKINESLAIKQIVTLYHECCCTQAGEVSLIVRLTALGDSIITEFQQLMHDPERFCFRTNKSPSMFECKKIDGDDINFTMVGSIYETTTLEDPDIINNMQKKIEVCTELQSCGVTGIDGKYICQHGADDSYSPKKFTINKIRMGDITGPCGNTTCPLAHKVKMYIRNLDAYKRKAGTITDTKNDGTKKICGTCCCKDDRWHREDCPELAERAASGKQKKVPCSGCGGLVKPGERCIDIRDEHFGTGATPKQTPKGSPEPSARPTPKDSKTQVQYVTEVPNYKDAIFRRNYIVENCYSTTYNQDNINSRIISENTGASAGCCGCRANRDVSSNNPGPSQSTSRGMGVNNPLVYNAEVQQTKVPKQQQLQVYNLCMDIADEKDCRCNPPKFTPPCKTFDCSCLPKLVNKALRKAHRPYCPLYTHKTNCPVTMMHEEEGERKEEEEDEIEPLPYGVLPIRLGPCPVMGRPCSVPDGFARMYKTAVLPSLPPSYNVAGKVCCSKEFERIKKAIRDYMKYQKDHDMRCINRYNVDTETRCCDKEQILLSLMGRECCGTHKLAILEKYKQEKK